MINKEEEIIILERTWSIEHDFRLHALYLGEPFFEDGLIHFFDGVTLFVCCRSLIINTDINQTFSHIIKHWKFLHPDRINCWGDVIPENYILQNVGYIPVYHLARHPWNKELVVFFDNSVNREKLRRRQREVSQKNRRRGISCKINETGELGWEGLRLIRNFIGEFSPEFGSVDISYNLEVPNFLASCETERTVRVDAIIEGKLVGLAVARCFGTSFAALHFVIWDRAHNGVCDALYAEILGVIGRRGMRACSLGLTIDEGLYKYKEKWGSVPVGNGFVQSIWEIPEDKTREESSTYHWPTAIALGYYKSMLLRGQRDT